MRLREFDRRATVRLAALAAWAGAILWLSLTPSPPSPDLELLAWDKLQHAAAYALLTLLAGRYFILLPVGPRRAWVLGFLAAVAYGGLIEIMQGLVTEVRRAEWGDLLADALGASLVLCWGWRRDALRRRQC
jgi:VanZ family protein